ncbi:Transposase IS200 like [Hymenobacter daecheongensis DSM 21074]|uniref:Transposase IS200 like n=1 Tax=Hymenobacter daecheongensis DSM 21074 TaxID=1121955 RepID=A0A1M6IJA1_9BACT|nr:transposase [Hymenobacter daecheongensis]SHJ34473.1 Transposase IS200 like [Hymenobacter daecheongensis DSM 21074]
MLPPGETIFTTFRLAGSVPARAFRELHRQRQVAQEAARALPDPAAYQAAHRRAEKVFFAGFDALLDAATVGPTFLEKEKIAELVAGELMLLEELGFQVLAFALLPNHVHAVLHLPQGSGVSFYKALQLLHQRTAAQSRRLLRSTLPPEADFWQTSSYDYAVHEAAELPRLIDYVRHNAERSHKQGRWLEWPYCYVSPAFE